MATLTGAQLADIRREVAAGVDVVTWDKPIINTALQSVEDWFEANRASLNTAINAAIAPRTLTAAQKKRLVAFWLLQKYGREL